jgi:D-serine deaminase-like pyridoxal phosphate-dependent protein
VRELSSRWGGGRFLAAAGDDVVTPALVVDADAVEHNVAAVIDGLADVERWRPHVKTFKSSWVVELLRARGVRRFKCATTLELAMLVEAGAPDVLFAMCARGANAGAVRALASRGSTAVSVLVEGASDLAEWSGAPVGVFVDIDTGLGRTGVPVEQSEAVVAVARAVTASGLAFAGLHTFEGACESRAQVEHGLDRLAGVVRALQRVGITPPEVITSGSVTAGWARTHAALAAAVPRHTLSPGTVVFHDIRTELRSPWRLGLRPAAALVTRVVSSSRRDRVTCDAGHKAIAADVGDPVALVAGWPALAALTPSEEHLPLAVAPGSPAPERGDLLALVPMHVCPTVNLHDAAILVRDGARREVAAVGARGHQQPLLRAS